MVLRGRSIRLTVHPKKLPTVAPTMPPERPTEKQQDPDECQTIGFCPKEGERFLDSNGGPVNVNTSAVVLSGGLKSYVFTRLSDQTIHSCKLHGTSANNKADDPCVSVYPEKAKLNFFLLVMNSVRVVFAKTLAFNTLLTIRALNFHL